MTDRKQEEELKKELDILKVDHQGSLVLFTAKRYAVRNHGKDTGEESIVQ